jgi:hypothetical protein
MERSFCLNGVEIDCMPSPLTLNTTMQQEWTVDPSADYRFPHTGSYFFTATFTYKTVNPLSKEETSHSVTSNTIVISVR